MGGEKKGFFSRLKDGLTKTRNNIVHGIDSVFNGFSAIDEDFYEELEEILIVGDIGVNATTSIIEKLRVQVKENHIKQPSECKEFLIRSIKEQMQTGETAYEFEKRQSVILVIGVNGVGKTTSVGKLAGILKDQGLKVLIAAADTFRAAAGEQLAEWANRAGVDIIKGAEGSDPASVIYDAVNAAKARNADVLLCDTAGRLHNKKNLMEELRIPDYKADVCVAFARGNVGKAKALASSEEFENVKSEALGLLKYVQDMEIPEIVTAIKKIGEYRLDVNDYLDILAIWYRDVLLFKATADVNHLVFREEIQAIRKVAGRSSYEGIENVIRALDKAKRRLDANVNFDLAMELLFLEMKENG